MTVVVGSPVSGSGASYSGKDLTANQVASSITETVLASVTIPAGTAPKHIYVWGLIAARTAVASSTDTVRVRCGTAGTTADALMGSVTVNSFGTSSYNLCPIVVMPIASTDYNSAQTNIITLTAQNAANSATDIMKNMYLFVMVD